MAISGGDGSIILTTKVDTSGITTGLKGISASAKTTQANIKGIGATTITTMSKARTAVLGMGTALKSLLTYFIGIQTVFAAIHFSSESAQFATQTEASIQRIVDIYGEASQVVGDFIDQNLMAIGMSRSAGASIASTYGNLLSVWADQATNAELTNYLLNQTAVIASKTGRTTTDVAERIRSGLLGNTEAIEDLGINVNIKTIEITDAFKRIANGRSWEQLNAYEQSQVRTLAILEQSTKKYGTTVAQTSATVRNQYQAAYENFKNTWGQVINTVLIPVLKVLTQVFNIATKGLQIIAGLTGKTIDTSTAFSSQEQAIGGAVDNQEALTDAVKSTNKELKKSLAEFDEINILSQDTAESGVAGAPGISGGVGEIGDLGFNYDNSIGEKISGDMTAIMAIVGGALVAVGLLLLFSGHIGWGIGFIIAGASVFTVSMATLSSGDQVTPISAQLMTILAIAGIALTAIGLILLFSGSLLWGIAFIIAGASALSVAVVALNQGNVSEEAEGMLINIMTIAGTVMLALGVILLCFGVVSPLSIGLVVAGAASLAGAIALKPKLVFENVSKFFTDNAGLIVGISLALLVLGIVLCVFGIVTPLSIGMIVVGVTGLVAELALNWNYVTEQVTKFFKDNSGLIVGVSLALLVIGIILCFTGVGIPLAIGLIVVGAAGLAAEVALNWNYIATSITNFIKDNSGLIVGVSLALIVLGIILLFTGVGIPLAIGLLVAGGASLAAAIAPNWNFIVDKVEEVWGSIESFWNDNIAPWFTVQKWAELAKNIWNGITSTLSGLASWFGSVFSTAWQAIVDVFSPVGEIFVNIKDGIVTAFKSVVNALIDGINAVVKLPFEGLNGVLDTIQGISFLGISPFDWLSWRLPIPQIPHLAKGAVIPPNREFLAVLGDQKHGTNIEAPLDTIVEAFNIALSQNGNGAPSREEHYYLDKTELMSILYKLVKGGERIAGESLVTGG